MEVQEVSMEVQEESVLINNHGPFWFSPRQLLPAPISVVKWWLTCTC